MVQQSLSEEAVCSQFLLCLRLLVGVLLSTALLVNLNPPTVRLAAAQPGWWRRLNDACTVWFDLSRPGLAREWVWWMLVAFMYQVGAILG